MLNRLGDKSFDSDVNMTKLPRRTRQVFWTSADQVLSSLTNLLPTIVVGRSGGSAVLGEFAIAFSVYLTALGFQRALITDPLLSTEKGVGPGHVSDGFVVSAVYACLVSGVVALIGALFSMGVLLAASWVLVGLLLQDFSRYALFSRRTPRAAFVVDLVWLIALALTFYIFSFFSVQSWVVAWGGSAALSALIGLCVTRVRPTDLRSAARWWWRLARALGILLALESVCYTLATQGVTFLLAGLMGFAQLGELRAAQVVLGPAGIVIVAANAYLLPRFAQRTDEIKAREVRRVNLLIVCLGSVTVLFVAVATPIVREVLFDSKVELSVNLLIVIGVVFVVNASTVGFGLHLKVLRRVRNYTLYRISGTIALAPVVLLLGSVWGALGAGFGYLIQATAVAAGTALAWVSDSRASAGS